MKLSQIKSNVAKNEETATITIYQPNDEPYRGEDGKDATISFVGPESKSYRAKREEVGRKAQRQNKKKLNTQEAIALRAELAASAVRSWTGFEAEDGSPLPCTPDNVVEMLSAEHVLVQVEAGIAGHASFFASASPS